VDAKFGVISDVDDTVIHTDAFSLLRMARTVFLGNARTRLPFKGVAAFYQALLKGHEQQGINPLFYVSNSPWNLYDLLSDFFNLHNIPIGPILFLRNWGFTSKDQLPTRRREHKVKTAHTILQLFPHLPFILVGDSGEQDPEIYHELVTLYPHRIRAVYIRNVGRDLARPDVVRALAQKVLQTGCTMILADDTLPLAQHAASQGWIAPEALPGIEAGRAADSAPPSPLEQLLGEPEEAEAPTVVVQPQPGTHPAASVADGTIEQALKTGEGKTPKAPTVIIKGNELAGGEKARD
jgi:phosphatidate phosphatase APP1